MAGRWGVQASVPPPNDRQAMHAIIFDELCRGQVSETSRQAVRKMVGRGAEAGADCVILGCTEICLLVDAACLPLPCLDSTAIHAAAAVDFALAA
jgi:aspartate racemase